MNLETVLILSAIINLITLICFFVLCSNVSSLKKKFCPNEYFGATFSMLIAGNQIEDAKKLLFEEITKDKLFVHAFYLASENQEARRALSNKYKPCLDMIGITLEFKKSDELISKITTNK